MASATILLAFVLKAFAGEPTVVEYAFRWDPREGGPSSRVAVQQVLDGKLKPAKDCEE